jgi:hypothetical protein
MDPSMAKNDYNMAYVDHSMAKKDYSMAYVDHSMAKNDYSLQHGLRGSQHGEE